MHALARSCMHTQGARLCTPPAPPPPLTSRQDSAFALDASKWISCRLASSDRWCITCSAQGAHATAQARDASQLERPARSSRLRTRARGGALQQAQAGGAPAPRSHCGGTGPGRLRTLMGGWCGQRGVCRAHKSACVGQQQGAASGRADQGTSMQMRTPCARSDARANSVSGAHR